MKNRSFACTGALLLAAVCSQPAQAELVVVMSAKSSASPTIEVVCQAYLGKTKVPEPVNQPEKNAARDEFYAKACRKDPAQVRSIWAKLIFTGSGTPPKEADNDNDVKKMVASDPNRVGYIDKKNADATVKVIAALN
jgi:hypothetical protein